jgi:hypothetical protein
MTRYGKKKVRERHRGGGSLQQLFGESDTSIGALNAANNQQKAAGEESLRIKNEENQTGGFAKDFMPHPSMTDSQALKQKGISDTIQQSQASGEFDNLVPKANECLRNQAGAGRKSIFRRRNKRKTKKGRRIKTKKGRRIKTKKGRRIKTKKGKTKKGNKRNRKKKSGRSGKKSRKKGGTRKGRRGKRIRFSQRPPLKV